MRAQFILCLTLGVMAIEMRAKTFVYSADPCGEIALSVATEETLLRCYAPVFAIDQGEKSHNRIGEPEAHYVGGRERVTVNPESAVVYVGTRADKLGSREVIHLLYRVHFTKLAFKPRVFFEMHRNAGLLTLITIDSVTRDPLLVTTVYTCGCYRGTMPTDRFPREALPGNWPGDKQKVWGKMLPAHINGLVAGKSRVLIRMEPSTHRVIDTSAVTETPSGEQRPMAIRPLSELHQLPLQGREGEKTSFYHQNGASKGYVKGAWSAIEGLTLGLAIFDVRIGTDKEYGDPEVTGTRFYTMLLPWNREVSRLDRFNPILRKLGFRLEGM